MKKQKFFWGLLFIAVAVFLIINQMGLITASISVWSIVLGVFFAAALIEGLVHLSFPGIFFPVGFLWIIFSEPLGLPQVSAWTVLLAALLLSIGCSILFPRKKFKNCHGSHGSFGNYSEHWEDYEDGSKVGEHQKVVDENHDGNIYCSNHFGATTKYISSEDFKGAQLENSFGEMKVYFDKAIIVHEPVTIAVNNSLGSMQLYIPAAWNVKIDVTSSLASVDEKTPRTTTGSPEVHLIGETSLGELSIYYV